MTKISSMESEKNKTDTELRLLQMHIEDQTAVMIREGILKKGDLGLGPTSPTNPGN